MGDVRLPGKATDRVLEGRKPPPPAQRCGLGGMCEDSEMKVTICCLLSFATSGLAFGQDFGPPQVITTDAGGAMDVIATDLDGDGDEDILSALDLDDRIAWYENLGGGIFGPQQVITSPGLS